MDADDTELDPFSFAREPREKCPVYYGLPECRLLLINGCPHCPALHNIDDVKGGTVMADKLTEAQADFLRQRWDFPNTHPYWGGMSGSGGARVPMAEYLRRAGYLLGWPEESDFGWQITPAGRAALEAHDER